MEDLNKFFYNLDKDFRFERDFMFKKLLLAGFFLISSCTTGLKTSRPELETKKTATGKTTQDKKQLDAKKTTSKPPTTPILTSPTNPAATASPLQLEENKFFQLEKTGPLLDALNVSSTLSVSHTDPVKAEFYKQKSIELINDKLSVEDLHQVSRSSDYGYLRGYSLFRLGNIEVQTRPDESKKFFNSVIELLPESDIAERSKAIIYDMEAAKRVSPQTIGVVLPLTGKNSAVGQRVLRGIQLGLGTNQSFSKFKIAVIDSEGRADTARKGVERLIKEDNVIAIIGGVLSKTVQSELIVASDYNVPFIYLSQKQGVNVIHPFSVRNALTAEMQVRQLVRTAMVDMDMKDFAILYPNDAYGIEYANAFWDEVLAQGGKIVSAQTYDSKETDFRPMVQRLVGTYYIEARKDEYTQKMKLFKQNLKNKNSRENVNVDDLLPPIQDFDALFIPDQARVIAQVGAFLNYSGVKETTIFSTNLLNTPGSNKKISNFNYPVLFVDSFISDGPNQINSDFARDYLSFFNEKPSQIEISAYDSGLILRQLLLKGAETREELGSALVQLKSFPGSYGALNVTSAKEILRPLVTLTFNKGEISSFKK